MHLVVTRVVYRRECRKAVINGVINVVNFGYDVYYVVCMCACVFIVTALPLIVGANLVTGIFVRMLVWISVPASKISRYQKKPIKSLLNNVLNLLKRGNKMFGKKPPIKLGREPSTSAAKGKDALPEVALAAILSYKRQKDIGDFMSFFLAALERNSDWLNGVVGKQTNFRCALMVGAGPNRFQLQEIIYPNGGTDIHLEVEHRDSEDFDKVAIAAILNLTNYEIEHLLRYIKTRLYENPLREDLLKGKELGVNFAVLRPFYENQYRLVERIVIGSSMRCVEPQQQKKRRRDEKSIPRLKRTKRGDPVT